MMQKAQQTACVQDEIMWKKITLMLFDTISLEGQASAQISLALWQIQ